MTNSTSQRKDTAVVFSFTVGSVDVDVILEFCMS